MTQHVLFVCKSCAISATQRDYMGQRGGVHLLQNLIRLHSQWSLHPQFQLQSVECLSACRRPCVVAFAAHQKATLMFGDLSPFQSATAILKLAECYHASPDGLVPRQERPESLKRCILATIPPIPIVS
jgi:predicted metal-binding protein